MPLAKLGGYLVPCRWQTTAQSSSRTLNGFRQMEYIRALPVRWNWLTLNARRSDNTVAEDQRCGVQT